MVIELSDFLSLVSYRRRRRRLTRSALCRCSYQSIKSGNRSTESMWQSVEGNARENKVGGVVALKSIAWGL